MGAITEELEEQVNREYVDLLAAAINAKDFMSIDATSGEFMLPVKKTTGEDAEQLYMRLTAYNLDGDYTLLLDGILYKKDADGNFVAINQ